LKTVHVTYFRPNGNWCISEHIGISEGLNLTEAHDEILKHRKSDSLYMAIQDSGDDKQPFIVPHLFSPTSYWE
jgi:hypothetical protein